MGEGEEKANRFSKGRVLTANGGIASRGKDDKMPNLW